MKKPWSILVAFLSMLLSVCPAFTFADSQAGHRQPSFTTWYWLNSAPRREWEEDFLAIKKIGIDGVVLWYGWSVPLLARAIEPTRSALDLCNKIGLRCYLGVWSGSLMHELKDFKSYLKTLDSAYGGHAALAGYYLDDTFAQDPQAQTVIKEHGGWVDWARLMHTNLKIEKRHLQLVLSDAQTILDSEFNIPWTALAPYFNRVMLYSVASSPMHFIPRRLKQLRLRVGDSMPLSWGIFTFAIGQSRNDKVLQPNAETLRRQIQEVFAANAGVDLYAFRVGDWTRSYKQLTNPLEGPENPAALLKYRGDLQQAIRAITSHVKKTRPGSY